MAGRQGCRRSLRPSQARPRRVLSVIGRSGCGKSTLLDTLAGLSRPTTGEILFEGRSLDGRVPDGVGVVFQEAASFSWLTSPTRSRSGCAASDVDPGEIGAPARPCAAAEGLVDFAKAYPAQLSGGMRSASHRPHAGDAAAHDPLDEPFGALDAQMRLIMGDEL